LSKVSKVSIKSLTAPVMVFIAVTLGNILYEQRITILKD